MMIPLIVNFSITLIIARAYYKFITYLYLYTYYFIPFCKIPFLALNQTRCSPSLGAAN